MRNALIVLFVLFILCSGCATYVTPGGPARLEEISSVDTAGGATGLDETNNADARGEPETSGKTNRADIMAVAARKPAASFPASIAIARVQAKDYESDSSQGVDAGNFRVLTTQELVTEAQFQRISQLPSVRGVAPISRLLLTSPLGSIDDLRLVAAKVQADVLLLYTIDTTFRLEGRAFGPLSVISLGLIPNRDAHITSTASSMFIDVRTGYVYGLAESTAKTYGLTNIWNTSRTVNEKRMEAERKSFRQLIPEVEKTWTGIVSEYATSQTR